MAGKSVRTPHSEVPYRFRHALVVAFFVTIFGSLAVRAAYLQVIDNDYLQSQGDARYLRVQQQTPSRGMILDRFGHPLAVSTPVDSIWAHDSGSRCCLNHFPQKPGLVFQPLSIPMDHEITAFGYLCSPPSVCFVKNSPSRRRYFAT